MAMYLGEEEVGSIVELKDDTALKMLNGTLEEFDNTKFGLSEIRNYAFYKGNLKSINLKGITKMGEYAFYQNKISNIENMEDITEIGTYGLTETTYNGELRFNNLQKLGVNALYGNKYVKQLYIGKDSNITTVGSYVFSDIGTLRENPEQNIIKLDLTNSSFSVINGYTFQNDNYWEIKLPKSLTILNSHALRKLYNSVVYLKGDKLSIGSYCFDSSDNIILYFSNKTVPTLNASNSFNNATNFKIYVSYNLVNAYKTATNWTTVADNIRGFAEENTFKQGQKLPLYSAEGYTLTWYSDIDLTQQVTTADNPENLYYCTISGEPVEVVNFENFYTKNCSISIVDTNGNSYESGNYIPVDTQINITVTPTIDGYVPYIQTINEETFTSPLNYTTISANNINITAVYYDGINAPIGETFADTDWVVIKKIIQDGQAGQYWQVGDTKPLEIEGITYNVRLSDMQTGRYSYANGTRTTNAVLEFDGVYTTNYKMNSKDDNTGGWAEMSLKTTLNTEILNKLPNDLKILLNEVVIASANGGGSNYTAITTSNNKLFLPCAEEVNLSEIYVRDGEGTVWDYYINATNSTRKKRNQSVERSWWVRSPYPRQTNMYTVLNVTGGESFKGCGSTDGVSPCWAW